MNSKFIHEQAQVIATRLPNQDQVQHLYQLILNRPPQQEELEFAKAYFSKNNNQQRWAGYVRSMLSGNEFSHVD